MKIYIAGKITGNLCYKLQFERAAMHLENVGHTVLNPATMPAGMKPADYMRICFAMLDTADAVLFLPDWQESAGAKLERAWCEYTGKPIFNYELAEITELRITKTPTDEKMAELRQMAENNPIALRLFEEWGV